METLENGTVFAVDRKDLHPGSPRRRNHDRPGGDERFLVGQRNAAPSLDARKHRVDAGGADDGGHDDIARLRRGPHQFAGPRMHAAGASVRGRSSWRCNGNIRGAGVRGLFGQEIDIGPRCQTDHREISKTSRPQMVHHFKCAAADRAGRAQQKNAGRATHAPSDCAIASLALPGDSFRLLPYKVRRRGAGVGSGFGSGFGSVEGG